MAYNNPLLDFADKRPILGFFVLPIAIYYGGVMTSGLIRKGKTGNSMLGNLFENENQGQSPLAGVRTEGGDASDLLFRATASTAPTKPGTSVGDEIQARPEGGNIRYDRNYHDSVFFPNLDYQDNNTPIHQTYSNRVTDTYVFAGINGMNKLR